MIFLIVPANPFTTAYQTNKQQLEENETQPVTCNYQYFKEPHRAPTDSRSQKYIRPYLHIRHPDICQVI